MHTSRTRRLAVLLALAVAVLAPAHSQDRPESQYQPQIGQPGKDSVWVPTPDRLIERMLQMADTTGKDVVVDLGSGDGRIPIAAARKFGARGIGIEYDADLVRYSIGAAKRAGVADLTQFLRRDLFEYDLSEATVVTLYISPHITLQLRPRLLALKSGTRVVSHHFTLGDWEPDESARVENANAYLWVVPARAQGQWLLRLGDERYDLSLRQHYQMLSGSAERQGRQSTVLAARLRGDDIRFSFIDSNGDPRSFTGRVAGEFMQGTASAYGQPEMRWSACRKSSASSCR